MKIGQTTEGWTERSAVRITVRSPFRFFIPTRLKISLGSYGSCFSRPVLKIFRLLYSLKCPVPIGIPQYSEGGTKSDQDDLLDKSSGMEDGLPIVKLCDRQREKGARHRQEVPAPYHLVTSGSIMHLFRPQSTPKKFQGTFCVLIAAKRLRAVL